MQFTTFLFHCNILVKQLCKLDSEIMDLYHVLFRGVKLLKIPNLKWFSRQFLKICKIFQWVTMLWCLIVIWFSYISKRNFVTNYTRGVFDLILNTEKWAKVIKPSFFNQLRPGVLINIKSNTDFECLIELLKWISIFWEIWNKSWLNLCKCLITYPNPVSRYWFPLFYLMDY